LDAPIAVIVEVYIGILNTNSIDCLKIDQKEVESIFFNPLNYFQINKPDEYFTHVEILHFTMNGKDQLRCIQLLGNDANTEY
jgi:hypothetical protein